MSNCCLCFMFSSPVCPTVSHSGSGIWTPLPFTVLCLFPPPMLFSILSSHYTIDVMQLWENKHNRTFVQHCLQQKTPTGTSIFSTSSHGQSLFLKQLNMSENRKCILTEEHRLNILLSRACPGF